MKNALYFMLEALFVLEIFTFLYLKKVRQPDNENGSVNRIQNKEYFSWKIIQKIWWKASPRPSHKKTKSSISLNQQNEML